MKLANRAADHSPVTIAWQSLPHGDGQWQGYGHIYSRLSLACENMAKSKTLYLSDEHVQCMAILGTGHEETMKAEHLRLIDRGIL